MNAAEQIAAYASGAPEGTYIEAWRKSDRSSFYVPANDPDRVASQLETSSERTDVFFNVGLVREPKPRHQRAVVSDIAFLAGLYLDLDLAEESRPDKPLPNDAGEALSALEGLGLPAPSYVVSTGNGLAAHFLFDEPWRLPDMETAEQAHLRLSDTVRAIIRAFKSKHGWVFDHTGHINRLTRPIGTLNHKSNPAKPVTLVRANLSDRCDFEAFEAVAASFSPQARVMPARSVTVANDQKEIDAAYDFRGAETGCKILNHAANNAKVLTEPQWYAQASFYRSCWDAEERFHELSAAHPGYSREEAQKKLEHAQQASPPRVCSQLAEIFGDAHCEGCVFRGSINSPAALGFGRSTLVPLQAANAYHLPTRRYVNIDSGQALEARSFSDKHLAKLGEDAHKALMKSRLTVKVDRKEYLPGEPRLIVESDHGETVLNTFRPGGVDPAIGQCEIIKSHFEYLFPDEAVRERTYDRLAYLLQEPSGKVTSALLVIGSQGTGKSFLMQLFEQLVGAQNVRGVDAKAATSRWNADLVECQVLVVHELKAFEKAEAYEGLKLLVSEDRAPVEQKHEALYDAATPRMIVAFSNHERPLSLDQNDRRFDVYASPAVAKDAEYYDKLFDRGLREASAFKAWLLARDISSFHPRARPPMTETKQALISESRPQLERVLEAMIEEQATPFDTDLFTLKSVLRELAPRRLAAMPTDRQLAQTLRKLGPVKVGQRSVDGRRPNLWALSEDAVRRMNSSEGWRDSLRLASID